MIQKLLVLCVGNICRSPIAEVLFSARLKNRFHVVIQSAGLAALVGRPADPMSCCLVEKHGYSLSHHRARQLTPELLFSSDLILTTTLAQQEDLQLSYPAVRGRVHRLGKWGGYDIVDPFQRPQIVFEQAYALIEQSVNDWCQRLWK